MSSRLLAPESSRGGTCMQSDVIASLGLSNVRHAAQLRGRSAAGQRTSR